VFYATITRVRACLTSINLLFAVGRRRTAAYPNIATEEGGCIKNTATSRSNEGQNSEFFVRYSEVLEGIPYSGGHLYSIRGVNSRRVYSYSLSPLKRVIG